MANVEIKHTSNNLHIVVVNNYEHTFDNLREAEIVRSYALSHNGEIPAWLQERYDSQIRSLSDDERAQLFGF